MPATTTFPELDDLGKWLRNGRLQQRLTQKELAAQTGIAQSRISAIEQGLLLPTLPQLARLARVLLLPLQWFLTGATTPGTEVADLVFELRALGVGDLIVSNATIPGAFRATEQVIALAISGDQPEPSIIEALPAVLAWNSWSPPLLRAYARRYDPRAVFRLAWLADVALTIHRTQGFPGGCPSRRTLEEFRRPLSARTRPQPQADDLGRPAGAGTLPPAWRRWKITYAAPLTAFIDRAQHLSSQKSEIRNPKSETNSNRE
jgi:transcriptional regulator with XRE-family HTH domain